MKVIHVLSHASGPLVYITACLCFGLLSMLLHLTCQTAAINTITFPKMTPAESRSLPEVCEEPLTESFTGLQMFGISASSWQRLLKTIKRRSASVGFPPTSVLQGPSSYFSATFLFVQRLPNIMATSYRVSTFWRDWWKGMRVKTASGWGHVTNRTERRCNKGRDLWTCRLLSKATHHCFDLIHPCERSTTPHI